MSWIVRKVGEAVYATMLDLKWWWQAAWAAESYRMLRNSALALLSKCESPATFQGLTDNILMSVWLCIFILINATLCIHLKDWTSARNKNYFSKIIQGSGTHFHSSSVVEYEKRRKLLKITFGKLKNYRV